MEDKKLKFAANLVPLVLSGEKTVTWRMFDDKDLKVGDNLILVNSETNKEFGLASIESVQEKRLGDIAKNDFDGHEKYTNKKEMLETYRSYYGSKVNNETIVKMISFKLFGKKKIMIETKRKVSILIPYKKENSIIFVYLQKRSKDAKRLPDYFGFFGGGIENNETPEQGLRREMKEEIGFIPDGYVFFKTYEFERSVKNIFTLEVDSQFEKQVKILEGEYGKWFSQKESLSEKRLINEDKLVLTDLFRYLFDA